MVSVNTQWLVAENRADFVAAGELLQAGGVVALPTETVYGLAADASQPEAVEKIFAAKGRPTNHPLIVHIASIEHLERWATAIPVWLPEVLEKLWPGPLTVLLPKRPDVSSVATGGLGHHWFKNAEPSCVSQLVARVLTSPWPHLQRIYINA